MLRLRVKEVAESKKISMTRLARISDVEYKMVRKIFQKPEAEVGTRTLDKLRWALRIL